MSEQFPVISDSERKEPLTQVRYKFIYAHHTPENMDEINNHLEDVDIIAFEPFHADDETERTAIETVVSRAFATDATDVDKQAAFDALTDHENGALPIMLLERFAGSGKRFVLIDITTAHPEYDSRSGAYINTADDIKAAFMRGNRNNASLRGYLERHVKAAAGIHLEREAIMASRLRQLGQQYPGSQVGVVIGTAHTLVGDTIAQEADTTAVWAVGSNNPRLSYEDEAIRTMILEQKPEVNPELLDKMLLQEYFSRFAGPSYAAETEGTGIGSKPTNPIDIRYIQDELIDTMTPEAVMAVLADLDSIRGAYDAKVLREQAVRDELRNRIHSRLKQLVGAYAASLKNRPAEPGGDVQA